MLRDAEEQLFAPLQRLRDNDTSSSSAVEVTHGGRHDVAGSGH